ncbi:MAG: glycosyl transferase [Candidatus Marinimicrobia bacterium]|nr:glycosyl transferase [Candidatus Neomarinimicrobiota bacterium]
MKNYTKAPSLSVVIPFFNELETIEEVFYKVYNNELVTEIILVDDCSTDGTFEKVKELVEKEISKSEIVVKTYQNKENIGKGGALRAGFKLATCDVIVIQDADLEYNPREYSNLILPIMENKADVVYGSRFIGGTHRVLFFWHYIGNKILTLMSNIFSNLNLTDMETCYKMFRRSILKEFELKSNRFGFEPEFTAKIAKANLRVYEMPISYDGRTYKEGKKITWKDGVAAFYHILYFNISGKYLFGFLFILTILLILTLF